MLITSAYRFGRMEVEWCAEVSSTFLPSGNKRYGNALDFYRYIKYRLQSHSVSNFTSLVIFSPCVMLE